LFVVENNLLSTNTLVGERQAQPNLLQKALAFGLRAVRVDGRDVFAVLEAAGELIDAMRVDRKPGFLEISVARLCAHVGPVSMIERIDPPRMIAGASACQPTDDPIVHCIAALIGGDQFLASACEAVLDAAVDRARFEFHRGNEEFLAYNESRKLIAPPPPKSFAV
jgi:TPP-dependent pyruvate/acetoin dehydrogenase alpha subunit